MYTSVEIDYVDFVIIVLVDKLESKFKFFLRRTKDKILNAFLILFKAHYVFKIEVFDNFLRKVGAISLQ